MQSFPTTALVVRLCFATSFLVVRTCMWPVVSFHFVSDVVAAEADRRHYSRWVACFYVAANLFLTFLQMLWTWYIIKGVRSMLFPAKKQHDS